MIRLARLALRLLRAALLVALAACTLRASHEDYGAYRTYRLADDAHERALAGASYLAAHPEGVYANEVRAALGAEEERFYSARAGSAEGLRDYLRVYPSGRYSERTRAELQALSQREADDVREAARARQASEAAAAEALRAHRDFTRDRLRLFIGVLAQVEAWGAPMEQVVQRHPDFDRAFASAPRPVCDATTCVKTLRVDFALPVDAGAVVQRVSELRVVLRLREEHLVGAELWLPAFGFSRWHELETRSPVADDDAEARAAAVAWALAELAPMLAAATRLDAAIVVAGASDASPAHEPGADGVVFTPRGTP